jgi:sialidase-1
VTEGSSWSLDLPALLGVRRQPVVAEGASAWWRAFAVPGERVTLHLTLRIEHPLRRAVIVHHGDPRALGGELSAAGWFLTLVDGRLELLRCDTSGVTRWRSRPVKRGWYRVAVAALARGGPRLEPHAAGAHGSPFERAPWCAWGELHGDLPIAATLTVGGVRDLAGGHVDLRFGERRGELITRCAITVGGAAEPPPMATQRIFDRGDAVLVGDDDGALGAWISSPVERYRLDGDGIGQRLRASRRRAGGGEAVRVFHPGDAGYAAFRIPALLRAGDGALLAFAEARLESVSDTCATKDLVMRRSLDNGRSWEPLQVVARAPAGAGQRSLMNPSPVWLPGCGDRLLLLATYLDASEWALAAGGGRGHLLAYRSDDHGRSWAGPIDVAAQLERPPNLIGVWPQAGAWRIQVGTLGHGVVLERGPHPGRAIFSGHATFGPGSIFEGIGFLFWTDDGGEHWTTGPAYGVREDGGDPRGWNESTLAELGDGSLLLDARQYRRGRPAGCRAQARVSWDAAGGPRVGPIRDDLARPDSGVQGSLLAVPRAERLALYACNPADPSARFRLTLRRSLDGGATWPWSQLLVAGRVGYSDLAPLAGNRLAVLYEVGVVGEIDLLVVPEPG